MILKREVMTILEVVAALEEMTEVAEATTTTEEETMAAEVASGDRQVLVEVVALTVVEIVVGIITKIETTASREEKETLIIEEKEAVVGTLIELEEITEEDEKP